MGKNYKTVRLSDESYKYIIKKRDVYPKLNGRKIISDRKIIDRAINIAKAAEMTFEIPEFKFEGINLRNAKLKRLF